MFFQVVVAGFGKEMYVDNSKKSGVKCWTNEEEPNPFSPCKTNFKFKGEKMKVFTLTKSKISL